MRDMGFKVRKIRELRAFLECTAEARRTATLKRGVVWRIYSSEMNRDEDCARCVNASLPVECVQFRGMPAIRWQQ